MINEFGKVYDVFSIPKSPETLMRILNFKGWECNPEPLSTPDDTLMGFSGYHLTCPQKHEFIKSLHGIDRYPYCPECGE